MKPNGEHPSLETLLDLTLDDLSDERAEVVREHLIDCAECRARVQELLDTSSEPPESTEPLSRFEKRAAWRDLQSALGAEGLDETPKRPEIGAETPERGAGRRNEWGSRYGQLAATALIAFGLGFFAFRLSVDSSPTLGTVTALPGMVRGTSPFPISCPPSDGTFVWMIPTPGDASPDAVYEIEIAAPNAVQRLADARPEPGGLLVVVRPRSATPDGDYEIQIFAPGSEEPLSTFLLRVDCE